MPYYAKRSPCAAPSQRPHFISYVDSLTCVRAHDNGVGSSTAIRATTGATPERPSTPAVERLQRAGARAVGALTFGHACRAPGEQCATASPDAIDFLLRDIFDALPIDVTSPESFQRPPHVQCN